MALIPLTDAASSRAIAQELLARLQTKGIVDFRPPPPEPTTCCGRGCNGCVWEGFFNAFVYWRDEALLLLD
ncbi:oxidoreductase [Xylophilus rhododendri]|uniref:Oxidoreductase n=1 Tax=Xylophilus rhododendri TaxID=2697032 RepID=A0A857IZP6_9BURK|nr:oxidoreductase-like domain-containing protein [Xylophilus rhododendri]QHI97080.1 oxidoreductase [Xylophilus rhododendri]